MLIPYDTRGHNKVDGALGENMSIQTICYNSSIDTRDKKMHKSIILIVDWRFLIVNTSKTVTKTLWYTTNTIWFTHFLAMSSNGKIANRGWFGQVFF